MSGTGCRGHCRDVEYCVLAVAAMVKEKHVALSLSVGGRWTELWLWICVRICIRFGYNPHLVVVG